MLKVIQFELMDIAKVYGFDYETIKNNEGKTAYLNGKLEKCNKAILSGKPENFSCYLDSQNLKNFNRILKGVNNA